MAHDLIFDYFRSHFPQYARLSNIIAWFPNGKNSIRVRFKDGQDYIFTYNGYNDWSYETVDCFIRRLKGD